MRNVRRNLFFAFAYNTLGIPIAAGALPVLRHFAFADHCRSRDVLQLGLRHRKRHAARKMANKSGMNLFHAPAAMSPNATVASGIIVPR